MSKAPLHKRMLEGYLHFLSKKGAGKAVTKTHKPLRLRTFAATQSGVTMIELIISMVIIAIAVTGALLVMNRTTATSADPMIRTQATAIAQSYLEEIILLAYDDPDGNEVGETRATFDDVDDYNGLNDNGARDQNGNTVSGLGSYQVQVNVANENLNFAGLAAVNAKRIDVTVTHPAGISIPLTAYRTDY